MDDETAEIELLQQNLNKTRQISKRMTTILDSFDTRLAKLEKSILPLYTATQLLNRRRGNIDKTLARIEDLSSNQQDIAADESLILRGIAFNASDLDLVATARLVETGAKKLTQLYTKVVAEGSSGTTPAPGSGFMISSFPHPFSNTIPRCSVFAHITRPFDPSVTPRRRLHFFDTQRGAERIRGHARKLEQTGREFREWVELMLGTAEEEYKLLLELSPLSSTQMLLTLIKKSLHKYNFLALSAYEGLLSLQRHWDDLLSRRDIKMGAMTRGLDTNVKLMDFTTSTIAYIEKLPQVQSAVESALYALGDGNWKMGEGVQVGKGNKDGADDDSTITEHFIHDIVTTAINSLTTLSRTQRRPPSTRPKATPSSPPVPQHPSAELGVPHGQAGQGEQGRGEGEVHQVLRTLDEVVERHRFAQVLDEDPKGRAEIGEEIVMLVIPSFQRFTQKQKDKEFSKNPQKYIKRNPDDVENELRSLFKR
ncbi:exocyst complex component, exo70 subunit [Pholiota molesta]|nr:exocyst complex component, exo70 subunit [Pholiota molesta]